MVRALLDGSKTQTRRVLKPQPDSHHWEMLPGYELKRSEIVTIDGHAAVKFAHSIPQNRSWDDACRWTLCPYGAPGGRLWVRETWSTHACFDDVPPAQLTTRSLHYWADGRIQTGKGRPSIHMPRWASRITLEVTGVRVERLQAISDADAVAEGIGLTEQAIGVPMTIPAGTTMPRALYRTLWESINGAGSWELNPWVWCVSFRRA